MPKDVPHINFSKIKHLLTDSRKLRQADSTMFFCLEGNGRQGTDFIEELYAKGVRYFVVPWDYTSELDAKFIHCQVPLHFLQETSKFHRDKYRGKVVGITGSNGKTVVKEWLFQILNKHYYTYRSPKSYNSQVGVPLSLWQIPMSSEIALIEAGISLCGEMAKLEHIVHPEMGIFTTLGNAHQENFSSLEEKAREKLQLFKNCKSIIYREDQELVAALIKEQYGEKELIAWSSKNAQANYYISCNDTAIQVYHQGQLLQSYTFPFSDAASLENIGHCLVAALHLGVPADAIDISGMEAIAMRLETKQGIHNCTLINDAYNSDVLSLGIALDALEQMALSKALSKTLILSDIEQSGQHADLLYQQIADLLKSKAIHKLIGIGTDIGRHQHLFKIAQASYYPTTDAFLKDFNAEDYNQECVLFKGARSFQFERIIRLLEERRHQTVLEIDLNALRENFNYFRALLKPQTRIMGMVKAFGYGSGSPEVARVLQQQGCDYLAVAVADEGVELRKAGISLPIVVMNPERNSFESMLHYRLEPAIYSFSELQSFSQVAQGMSDYPIHLKFDTGMHRLGFCEQDIPNLSAYLKSQNKLKAASIFSHLAAADEAQSDHFTLEQIKRFERIAKETEKQLGYKVIKHILNSAGTERFTKHQNDMVRLGIGMYGISQNGQQLRQLATLKTNISQIRSLSKKETVGYGRKGKLQRDSRIATIPIGYADGVRRQLGNGHAYVLVNGQKAPFIGNICMDLAMIDITDIDAQEGDEVILTGEALPITILADKLNTIPYEVMTSISQRVKRVYVE